MTLRIVFTLGLVFSFVFYWTGCGSGGGDSSGSKNTFEVTGVATSGRGAKANRVMAVNPRTSNPNRVFADVDSTGKFTLKIEPNRPYILAGLDTTQKGSQMILWAFQSSKLDTLTPTKESGTADLGTVTPNDSTKKASITTTYDALLTQLGLTSDTATSLAAIDDLSLRYLNPDVDANGLIDSEEGKSFLLDFHIRANTKKGSANGATMKVSDMTDLFFSDSGANAAYPDFNLGSIYVIVPKSFDSTQCATQGGQGTGLASGCAFSAVPSTNNSSYSNLSYGDNNGFGPDYNWTSSSELPGSDGNPATLTYTFPGNKVLTFTNVVTRTKASLTAEGTIMPFLKFDTSGGKIVSFSYKWMKRASSTSWTQATAEEVKIIVSPETGYAGFYVLGSKSNKVGFRIPEQATGTVKWEKANTSEMAISESQLLNLTPNDICSMAISYDDTLGLRLFAGGADPNTGVTACP